MSDLPFDTCSACMHALDPHVFVAIAFARVLDVEQVPVSGVVLCPECDCLSTWSIHDVPRPEMPPAQEVARIREEIFRR